MTRIVIVDDDPMVRTGLRLILGGAPDLELAGEAGDGRQAVEVVRTVRPDVVLMDIRMPVQDGLVTTEQLLAEPNPPRVLVLTTFDADDLVLRALRLGASGFLLKDTPPPKMIEAVRAVARGEPALSPSVTYQVIAAATGARRPEAREELSRLTERELEVAIEVARGSSNAEIAERLHMSVATVKANISRIFAKLGTDNRVQVAMKVRDAGLA
ncbi:DNA-binding response regulator [Thermopolyspora flexuosa]|uniref:LuxR family two component transcriptional regulator n=1 Tax=Thermopolyspora flexuosa TaxID=103836 RepID=A0A543IVA7_9ACTN|nr:response regulator transcription factor [Thermopolyspora flexuosa]TQM74500.1 LuxR family two component transcriptional regulator [Thermopolyspora flexuosa]GGM76649.1 DNA-binding response regulator [Thermopolyspora flexuosa]